MEPAELQELIQLLRDNGVTHYKCGDLELSLGVLPVLTPPSTKEEPSPPLSLNARLRKAANEKPRKING
jgi:hypothetical protein